MNCYIYIILQKPKKKKKKEKKKRIKHLKWNKIKRKKNVELYEIKGIVVNSLFLTMVDK